MCERTFGSFYSTRFLLLGRILLKELTKLVIIEFVKLHGVLS